MCSHRDWAEANNHREPRRHDWRKFFAELDAVVGLVTTPGRPATAVPAGRSHAGIRGFEAPN